MGYSNDPGHQWCFHVANGKQEDFSFRLVDSQSKNQTLNLFPSCVIAIARSSKVFCDTFLMSINVRYNPLRMASHASRAR